ncbi:MAG TPA: sigma-70 family RNA polymerase sigma factor [Gammaproteobacteria bacterium]|nr:sigma-70 family RNA polymerase sigma factor [Gammaproteobacteria bacterium]
MTKEEAFGEHYQTHYRQVRGLCRQLLGSTERAEDAAQEAFMRAYTAFGRYDPAQPFAPWIMSIAHNYCLDLLRRRRTEAALFGNEAEEAAAVTAAPGVDGLGAVLTTERASAVNAAVAKLPERYRVPLALAYYADADYDEIATTLGITRTHVGVLLCRGKQMLRQTLANADTDAHDRATERAVAGGASS